MEKVENRRLLSPETFLSNAYVNPCVINQTQAPSASSYELCYFGGTKEIAAKNAIWKPQDQSTVTNWIDFRGKEQLHCGP